MKARIGRVWGHVLGARVCYWAASTVLDAWPSGRAYPESWVDAA